MGANLIYLNGGAAGFPFNAPRLARLGDSVELPSGFLGLWHMDEYQSTPVAHVPNKVSAGAVSNNILSAPRHLFGSTGVWGKSIGVTVTDDYADGASRVECAAGFWFAADITIPLPAGTYTLVVEVKSLSGDVDINMYLGGWSPSRAVLASGFTRLTYTATVGAGDCIINGVATLSGAAADLLVKSVELFAGAADLGSTELSGHLMLGNSAFSTVPVFADHEVDVARAGIGGFIQFSENQTLSAFTVQAVVSNITAGGAIDAAISRVQAYGDFTAYIHDGNTQTPTKAGQSYNLVAVTGGQAQQEGLHRPLGLGRHLLTWRGDATSEEFWVDDIRLFIREGGRMSWVLRDLFFNTVVNGTLWGGNKYFGLALWDRVLSDAELAKSLTYWESKAAAKSLTMSGRTTNRVFAFEGDSIFGAYSYSAPYLFGVNADPAGWGTNFATSGFTLALINARASAVDALIPTAANGGKFILTILIGANDLHSYPGASDAAAAAAYLADYAAYCDARRAAGWEVVVCTILPQTGSTHNIRRAIVNSAITASWVGIHCDAVADFAGNATMGPDAAASNGTYYADGTHPTAAGHAVLETILRPVINAL